MIQYIDKAKVVAEINNVLNSYDPNEITSGRYAIVKLREFIDNLEAKEVDLDDSATHYILHKHTSPLSAIMHQADLKAEMQYHKDIEDAYKAGFEFGLLTNNKDKSFDATVCKAGNTYLKEMDKDAIAKALESYKDGDKVKVIIIKEE